METLPGTNISPGPYGPALVAPPQGPGTPSTTPTPAPAVISSSAASNNLADITSQHAAVSSGIQNQATTVAANQAQQTAATTAAQQASDAKAAAAQKAANDTAVAGAKVAAATGTATPAASSSSLPGTLGSQSATTPSGATIYYNTDGSGSSTNITDASGRPVTYNSATGTYVYSDGTPISQSSSTPNSSSPNDLSSDEAAANQAQTDYQNAATNVQNTINNIQSGIIPLTAGEQAQVTSLQQSFQQLIDKQNLQNTGASGAANVRGYQSGAAEYDPTFQANIIGSVVTAGLNKVSALNTQMASAVAQLTQSLKDNDIKSVTDAWNIYQSAATERISALNKTVTDTQTAIQNAQAAAYKAAQDAVTNQLNSEKQTWQEQQDTIDNAFKQQQITETQRNDLMTQQLNQLKYQLDQQKENYAESGGTATIAGLPSVSMSGNGNPSAQDQAAFLAQLPQDVASLVKGVANYTLNPTSLPTRNYAGGSGLTQQQILSLVAQYDPTYDSKQYATRAAMQKNVTSGAYSQVINSANTLVQHLADLKTAADQLDAVDAPHFGDSSIPLINSGVNAIKSAFGDPATNNFNTEADAIASEAAKIYKGTGSSSESEITAWKNSISASASPAQKQAAIQTIISLMAGKLSTISQQYNSVMGKPGNFSMLTPQSAKVLQSLGIDPSTVDPNYQSGVISDIGSNIQTALSQGHSSQDIVNTLSTDPTIGNSVQSALSAGYTPDEVLQYLQSNNQ